MLSGPSCGKALVDLGADVIKVEPPEGDLTRTAQPRVGGLPVYFAQQNCGKRCISVDLRHRRPAATSSPDSPRHPTSCSRTSGRACSTGSASATTRCGPRNPKVVYCSITGYGQDGPMASRRAYAPVMHAELGLMEFSARRLHSAPRAEAVSHADLYAGLQATVGILAALLQRERTGAGQHIDVSMAEVMLQATEWTGGRAGRRSGRPDAHLRQLQRAGAPARRRHGRARARRSGVELSGVVRGDAAARPRGRRALRDPRGTPRQPRRDARRCSRSSRRPSPRFDDFEAALGKARLAVGEMRPLADVGLGAVGAGAGCVGRRGRRAERAAAAAPFAVPILGRVGRHDRAGPHGRGSTTGRCCARCSA